MITSRMAVSSDSIVKTASASNASAARSTSVTPGTLSFATLLRFQARTSWPAFTRLRAMTEPMLPRPMNPICMVRLPSFGWSPSGRPHGPDDPRQDASSGDGGNLDDRICTETDIIVLSPFIFVRGVAMEWSDVRIFLAVARSGTLGGAARSLQTSHPTVGRRLRAFEQAIGHTLFQRTADGLVLTDEGHGIIALAEQMEEGALAMERRLAGQEQNLKGSLRISSADWFGAYVLPPILADFSKAYPNVDVEILTGTRLFNLAQREADVAFRIVPFDTADVVQRRLFRLEYGVYTSPRRRPTPNMATGPCFADHPRHVHGPLPRHRMAHREFPQREAGPAIEQPQRSGAHVPARRRHRRPAPGGRRSDSGSPQPGDADAAAGTRHLDGISPDLRRLQRLRAFISTVSDHLANATA